MSSHDSNNTEGIRIRVNLKQKIMAISVRLENQFSIIFGQFLLFFTIFVSGCTTDTPNVSGDPVDIDPIIPENSIPDNPSDKLPIATLSFSSLNLSNSGDKFSCVIYGLDDVEWYVKSDQPWCTVSNKGNILKIESQPNETSADRTATVSIINYDDRLITAFPVTQSIVKDNEQLENFVSTKQSYVPMFDATWCPYCPDMDRALTEIQKRWTYPILPMRIHITNSELYNPLSQELSVLYNNESVPTCYFENSFKVENLLNSNLTVNYFWNQILSNTSGNDYFKQCSSIGCNASMTENKIEAEVNVTPIKKGTYRLLIFIVEDEIIKPQMSESDGSISNYCHNSVLVGSMTSVYGQEIELSSPTCFTFSGTTPVNSNLSNLRLLIVLERDDNYINYSEQCWHADNCLSVPLGKSFGNGRIENIYIGKDIIH